MLRYAIGIDVGGTKIAGVAVDEHLDIFAYKKIQLGFEKNPDAVIKKAVSLIKSLQKDLVGHEIVGVGVAVPGIIDVEKGMVVYSSNLDWKEVPIVGMIARDVEMPCFLEHDVRSGAIAELLGGPGKNLRHFIYVSVGTGIAGTIVWDRKIIVGHRGMAGEIGHTTVLPNGPLCRCGRRGCLEAVSSGSAMEREAFHAVRERIEGPIIVKKAEEGNPLFQEIIRNSAFYLGVALANLAKLFDPEAILLGGGVSEAGDLWFQFVKEAYLEHMILREFAPELVLGRYKSKASAVGAALLPFYREQ